MNSLDDYLATLPRDDVVELPPATEPSPRSPAFANELVVDKKTGAVRQAGADATGAAIVEFKQQAERSLFTFMIGVLGRKDLTVSLHKPLCDGLQAVPPRRKLRLYPRHHRKTSIVAHGLPIHMTIQPADANVYFPGASGTDVRVLLSGETEALVKGSLRVIQTTYESNKILRGLWPHIVWDKPRAESKKWSELELLLRRDIEYPEATITVRGVGGAITGMHPNVLIKDDLISLEARNSDAVMQSAIEWHKASRGLIEGNADALEFIIGTRWKKFDLYSYIIDNDPLIDVVVRSIVEDGAFIFPEKFDQEVYDRLRRDFGDELFSLLYMNVATGVGLTDFDMAMVRAYRLVGNAIDFDTDERDVVLADRSGAGSLLSPASDVGVSQSDDRPFGRDEFLTRRYPSRLVA